ncbi:MAG TPA: UbiD family decarboxylase [Chitinophagales bacterium]|nr:UbiD family decarboxylase [Chitinophagales bacterium]HMZ34582.1 UbiD family decarboxylase [Chitinophagales bacterium]HNB48246.1 UbiD family decarboxylase [Chitinophagales bacterium]HND81911.1 UbiD family decarboxylase [Chitinophagales bacterium]HNF17799.1 UbiD family decarboxylase [Chitinophagales bacterium]
MKYKSLQECIDDLDKSGQLIRITEEVDPYLEAAAIHLRIHEAKGKAILFEKIKGSKYRAVSNLFGTTSRSEFIFRDTLPAVKKMIALKSDPMQALKNPIQNIGVALAAWKALPKKVSSHSFEKIKISDLPQIHCWEKDGGAFVTLPIVYTEDADKPGAMHSNLGMYRIQLSGNDYVQDKEIGLHYQLHRGIGVHQTKWNKKGMPMKVSVFIGGPPSHSFAAVMPLPEGLSELTFAGALGGRRFRYMYDEEGYCLSTDADFVITGEVYPNENKAEGPFGDHLGYYSLKHDFPLMRVKNVYAKKNAIWSFTVVGRPPQEDTAFGNMIHEMTGTAISKEIPGLHEVHAVDAAGVHPLLLAIGSERYTPYYKEKRPQEILTIANHILGTGQLSLAKFLFICDKNDNETLSTHDEEKYFHHILERIDLSRDIHFQTKTSIDTLDYSGDGLNTGSKVIIAACGDKKRDLLDKLPTDFSMPSAFKNRRMVTNGILALEMSNAQWSMLNSNDIADLNKMWSLHKAYFEKIPLLIICDDADFVTANFSNFLWVTFTRSNPSNDIYGINERFENKHWCCDTLIIDARIKSHHAPVLEKNAAAEKRVDEILSNGKF